MYIDDLLPHAPLELCSYWGCGQVFHIAQKFNFDNIWKWVCMHLGGEASMQKVIVASIESFDTQNIISIMLYHDCSSYDNNYDLDI